ncbi:PEP-CTERM sorting domain-containing protein [bacterium]|nr:MAG: PEP-CTERM sorting domain-containing protein [bacterium]
MKRSFGAFVLFSSFLATASADPFQGLAAEAHAQYTVSITGTYDSYNNGGTEDKYGDQSLYAGVGDYGTMSSTWDYVTQIYIGDDEYGNPIYDTITEPQYESGTAQAYAYGRFDRGGNAISAEVYAYAQSEASYSGSQAFASAFASSTGSVNVTFTLTNWTPVKLFSSTFYDTANITLLRDGFYYLDSANLYGLGTVSTSLAPGSYQLVGDAYYGGADFSIQAVPEPASLAALGLGLAMLRRRRR